MTERYAKVLKKGKADRNKLFFRSLAIFDRRMSLTNERHSKEISSELKDEADTDRDIFTPEKPLTHVAGFSIDEPANDDEEEEEDDDELALAALESLDAIEVFKHDQFADTKIHHAQIPLDNFQSESPPCSIYWA